MHNSDVVGAVLAAAWLAGGTLVSEDLAAIAAGVMVAEGQIPFAIAAAGCYAGILTGDLLLFLTGRVLGRRALELPLVNRLVSADAIARSSAWLGRRAGRVVLLTRLVPGSRVPTYVAAGALRTDGWKFAAYFAVAAAVWTPLLIGLSAAAGQTSIDAGFLAGYGLVARVTLIAALLFGAGRLLIAISRWQGRRRLYGTWRRLTRWEFWPPWVFYPPVVAYIAWLALKYRSLTVFTAANPGILGGGFVGESKFDILDALPRGGGHVAQSALLPAARSTENRIASARRFIQQAGLEFPIVIKPNQGQRGSGVTIARTMDELVCRIAASPASLIVQEYAPGHEFGVFYCRHPRDASGRIFSLVEKRFPSVTGDGRRTLEALILADERAVCLEHVHRRVHRGRLDEVPALGERVQLVEIGSHCRGALFLDASPLITPALETAFDTIAAQVDGFYFGRFDVRTPSIEDFKNGNDFKIVELNGVTSEAAHIYDPSNSLWTAYRVLCAQWRLAFAIGSENQRQGVKPTQLRALLSLVHQYRRMARLQTQQTVA